MTNTGNAEQGLLQRPAKKVLQEGIFVHYQFHDSEYFLLGTCLLKICCIVVGRSVVLNIINFLTTYCKMQITSKLKRNIVLVLLIFL